MGKDRCASVRDEIQRSFAGAEPTAPEPPLWQFRRRATNNDTKIEYGPVNIYPRVIAAAASDVKPEVTIVTQMSIDRLQRLRVTLGRIDPSQTQVSAAIFVPEHLSEYAGNETEWPSSALKVVRQVLKCDQVRSRCAHLDLHLVYLPRWKQAKTHVVCDCNTAAPCTPTDCNYYPINILRNIAWNYVTTPWVFVLDIE